MIKEKLLFILFLIYILTGCGVTTDVNQLINPGISDAQKQNDKEPKDYEPFLLIESEDGYIYQIYNNNVLVREGESVREPNVEYITDTLILVWVQTGTGKSTNWGFFYDYATGKISETFIWMLDYTETKVVLGKKDKVVVRDIFDDSLYFEISNFNQPLAQVADSIINAVYSDDESAVTVTYVVENSYEIVTQEFSLPE